MGSLGVSVPVLAQNIPSKPLSAMAKVAAETNKNDGKVNKVLSPIIEGEKAMQLDKLITSWERSMVPPVATDTQTPQQLQKYQKEQERLTMVIAKDIWNLIRPHLSEKWVIPGVEWLINNKAILQNFPPPMPQQITRTLLDAIEFYLVAYPEAFRLCAGLSSISHPRGTVLLEKIFTINKDSVTKSYAALALALRYKRNVESDDDSAAKIRGGYLRYALENLPSGAFGNYFGLVPIADIFKEELYQLNSLILNKVAPCLRGKTLEGSVVDTAQMQGKVVVLIFAQTFTPEIKEALSFVQSGYEKLAGKGINFIVIAQDTPESLLALRKENKWTFPIIADPTGEQSLIYRIKAPLYAYMLDQKGRIRYKNMPSGLMMMAAEQLTSER